jgi:hypothetical protein
MERLVTGMLQQCKAKKLASKMQSKRFEQLGLLLLLPHS